jgi:hypothetical protein
MKGYKGHKINGVRLKFSVITVLLLDTILKTLVEK